jgi:hypothetical protein
MENPTSMESKCCATCQMALIQKGVHMGTPFAIYKGKLYCVKCYDAVLNA